MGEESLTGLVDALRELDERLKPYGDGKREQDNNDKLNHVCLLILEHGISNILAEGLTKLLDGYSANLERKEMVL